MPQKARQYRPKLVEQEGRIQLAIQALKKREVLTIRRAAVVFSVPYTTLHDRMNNATTHSDSLKLRKRPQLNG
jgi:uncharacterized protein YqjF (DUF2071 family)